MLEKNSTLHMGEYQFKQLWISHQKSQKARGRTECNIARKKLLIQTSTGVKIFRSESKIKTFSDEENLREFMR